jgi:uncharacterized protein
VSPTAPLSDQLRLLDVQALDTQLAQLAHRRRTLPELALLADLDSRARVLRDELVAARTLAGDVDREAARAEADVEQVRARETRNAARLAAGTGTAKDLQALQKDSEALARRQGDLEEVQLEVMERQEQAAAAVAGAEQRAAGLESERAEVVARRDAALADIDRQAQLVRSQRVTAVAGLDAGLLALYDRVRAAEGGLGAAPVLGDRCGGCRLQLTPVELGRVRGAAPDAVVRCEECGRILVRVPEKAPRVHQ